MASGLLQLKTCELFFGPDESNNQHYAGGYSKTSLHHAGKDTNRAHCCGKYLYFPLRLGFFRDLLGLQAASAGAGRDHGGGGVCGVGGGMFCPLQSAQDQRGGAEPDFHRHLRLAGRADAGGGGQGRDGPTGRPGAGRAFAAVLRRGLYVRALLPGCGRPGLRRGRVGRIQVQHVSPRHRRHTPHHR